MANKGFPYERELCHKLSAWWLGVPLEECDEIVFWRTAGSGAHATVRAKKGKQTRGRHGDIGAVDERGKPFTDLFVLEAKRGYNKATIADLMDKPGHAKEAGYDEWIRKLQDKKESLGVPFWVLIHRRDHRRAMLYLPAEAVAELGCSYSQFTKAKKPLYAYATCTLNCKVDGVAHSIFGYRLDRFLEMVNADDIKELQKRVKHKKQVG